MTRKQKNWLISLSAIVLAGGVAVGVALPLTMCSRAPTPGPGPTPIEKIELKRIGTFKGRPYDPLKNPNVYIQKDQNLDDENVLRYVQLQPGSVLETLYGCSGLLVFGSTIERDKDESFCYNKDINADAIPKSVLVEGVEKNVKGIADFGGEAITSVFIPNFIEIICNGAFNRCSGLTSLDLSNATNLQKIGNASFQLCSGLTSLNLSGATSLHTIDNDAFDRCSHLTGDLIIPNNVIDIGEYAFFECSGLTSLDLSNATSLQTIDANAFNGCTGLTGKLTIPASLTSIGEQTFAGCKFTSIDIAFGNTSFVKVNNLGSSCDAIVSSTQGNQWKADVGSTQFVGSLICGTPIIPASVTSIGIHAFRDCSGLTGTLIIPASVTSIGAEAFLYCSNLTGTLTIPASVTSIDNSAFNGVGSTDFKFLSENPPATLGTSIFGGNVTKTLWVPSTQAKTNYDPLAITKFGLKDTTYIKVA